MIFFLAPACPAGAFLILAAFSAKTEKIRERVLFSFTTLW
jgi:hypothetical protein